MSADTPHPLFRRITEKRASLTPKGRVLAEFVLKNPRKAVFMTTRQLAEATGVSDATVVRFVARLGFDGFTDFIQALRDYVDSRLTLLDRTSLTGSGKPETERFRRAVFDEIDNLKHLVESFAVKNVEPVIEKIAESPQVYVVGSRLSYSLAWYLGWSLSKLREGVRILSGSDSTSVDWLTIAPAGSLVVIIATSRYPNELVRLCKLVRRLGLSLVVISDSAACPLNPFAQTALVAATRRIHLIGSIAAISCLINFMILELAGRGGESLSAHHERLERAYREQDILFHTDEIDFTDT